MRQLFYQLYAYKWRLSVAIGSSVINKILDLMPPLLVSWVIDTVNGTAPSWIQRLTGQSDPLILAAALAIIAFVIFGFESLFQWLFQFSFQTLAQRVQHDLRIKTFCHLQNREMAFFENHRLGETLSLINDDVNQLERFLNTEFNTILQLGIVIIFSTFVLFSTSWQLAIIALIPIPFIIAGSLFYQSRISPKYRAIRSVVGQLNSRLENSISGIMVVKSFTAESYENQRVSDASMAYLQANNRAIKLNALYVPLIRIIVSIGFSGILLIGSYWILTGKPYITVGELVLFSMLIQRFLWPLTSFGNTLDSFERAHASAKRIFDFLQTSPTIVSPLNCNHLDSTVPSCSIQFKSVSFHYSPDIPILKTLSFQIKAGETIGIAGTTGSGKSTLIKLLLRLYDPVSGTILIDNTPIQSIDLHQLRSSISLVSQDIYLFHGSIRDNIAYGLPSVQPDALIHAATLAELHPFIMSLPNGYDSIVGERGIKLSGGQKQRLSIARAILKNAPIIVFDEATSSVDTETEKLIKHNLEQYTTGKTAIIIAHRLSTIRHADRIMVITDGQLMEEGRHDQLIHHNGIYADLWHTQIND